MPKHPNFKHDIHDCMPKLSKSTNEIHGYTPKQSKTTNQIHCYMSEHPTQPIRVIVTCLNTQTR